MSRITALVGAQYGSEGKGLIAEAICRDYDLHVRTGAPNAGHTYYVDHEGERQKVVARSVPCGAANPNALLFIGAGGLIDVDLLLEEVAELDALGLHVSDRLMVDEKAMVIDPVRHHRFEGGVGGEAHKQIGSTGEGVGPARMAKISRGTFTVNGIGPSWANITAVGQDERLRESGLAIGDTAQVLNTHIDRGASVLLEGTQGSGLSLVHGPWPYTTSSDTNAGQLAVDAGIAPQLVTDTLLVARTYPIRVAGTSGPLKNEIDWERVGQPEERTTVTKKVRRVGEWDLDLVRRAIMLNRPDAIALTFADYLFDISGPSVSGLSISVLEWIDRMDLELGVPVTMLGVGPDSVVFTKAQHRGRFIGRDTAPEPWPSAQQAYWGET